MKVELLNPDEAPYQPGRDLNVLIMGEDSVMSAKSHGVLELLAPNLPEAGRLIYQAWNFEGLVATALREKAAMETALADVIVIGFREAWELPWIVHAWMERWLELRQGRPGALVIMLDADVATARVSLRMLAQLKQFAAAGHLDFFVKSSHGGDEQWGGGPDREAARQFSTTGATRRARIAGRRPRGFCNANQFLPESFIFH
jgi:hypothetical protein